MTWVYPGSLWGFILAGFLIAAAYLVRRRTRLSLKAIGRDSVEWQVRAFLRDLSMAAFMVLVILAMAEPRRGREPISGESYGLNIAVAFDISRSMLVEDVNTSRLDRGIAVLSQIIRTLEGARFSLIPFKGNAAIKVPMTEDRVILNSWIDRLGPGLATTAGTNLEIALREASESFPSGVGRSKIILLITDGESLTGNIGHAARNLIQEGIFVHAAIAGTAEGGPIPLDDGTYVADESGRPVVSRADFKVIEQLVDETGGSVHDLGRAGAAAELLQAMRKDLEFAESRGISFTGVYRYRMYLLPSLLMLLLNLFARIIPWRRR